MSVVASNSRGQMTEWGDAPVGCRVLVAEWGEAEAARQRDEAAA